MAASLEARVKKVLTISAAVLTCYIVLVPAIRLHYCSVEFLECSTFSTYIVVWNFRAFQRFAVRTSKRIEDLSKMAAEKKIGITEQMKDFSRNVQESMKNK